MTETAVAGAALIVTLLAMWATRPPPACAMAPNRTGTWIWSAESSASTERDGCSGSVRRSS